MLGIWGNIQVTRRQTEGTGLPVAGWYQDPQSANQLRFWDGKAWSDKVLPTDDGSTESMNQTRDQAESLVRQHHQETALAASQKQLTEINERLESLVTGAQKFAAEGKIDKEEFALAQYFSIAQNAGGKAALENANQRVNQLTSDGKLRIGSSFIGNVKREHGLSQYARLNKLDRVTTGGKSARVYSDRIFHGENVYIVDQHTGAQVILDGVTQITQRPTLTRMALLSPLPGTALIPGLAFQKKKENDMRTASFIVASAQWSFTIPIDPNMISGPREIAERINRIAAALETPGIDLSARGITSVSEIEELKEIRNLLEAGVVNSDEAEHLKLKVLNKNR